MKGQVNSNTFLSEKTDNCKKCAGKWPLQIKRILLLTNLVLFDGMKQIPGLNILLQASNPPPHSQTPRILKEKPSDLLFFSSIFHPWRFFSCLSDGHLHSF